MRSGRMHLFKSKEYAQGRLSHFGGCSSKKGMGIELEECTLNSLREQGTLFNNEGSPTKALVCAHALFALIGSLWNQNLSMYG